MDSKKHKFYLENLKRISYIKQDHWDIFKELFLRKFQISLNLKNLGLTD